MSMLSTEDGGDCSAGPTRPASGELTESPRRCPTRHCRPEGSAQHSGATPARAARLSKPLWGSAPAEYSGAGLATGGE